MSGGKSKTCGKAVHLTIVPEVGAKVSSVACRTNFQKSLKNPLTNRSSYGTMNTSNERGINKMTIEARPPPKKIRKNLLTNPQIYDTITTSKTRTV